MLGYVLEIVCIQICVGIHCICFGICVGNHMCSVHVLKYRFCTDMYVDRILCNEVTIKLGL